MEYATQGETARPPVKAAGAGRAQRSSCSSSIAMLGRRLAAAAVVAATSLDVAVHAQVPLAAPPRMTLPVAAQWTAPGAVVSQSAFVGAPGAQVQVAPVQFAPPAATERPLDPRIAAMPVTTEQMQIIHHRSRLLITNQPTWRISVTDPAICEVVQYSPTELAVLGIGLGTTDVWLWFEGSDTPLMYSVTVIRDPSLDEQRRIDFGKLERRLQVLYPNSKVYLIPLSRKIIVRGQARDPEEAARIMQVVRDELINQQGDLFLGGYYNNFANVSTNTFNDFLSGFVVNELQVPGEYQVMMRVRIAEVSRSQARTYGLDWSAAINDARYVVTQSFATAAPVLTGIFNNGQVAVALEALASNGYAKIISDATLVTLSGEPAAFLAGGEFAVPSTVGLSGVGVATTTFRGFGTSLIATPTVVNDDLIRITIIPELSEINNANTVGGVPGVNVKRVQTRVELREGQTIVLGGLFERQQSAEVTRIPWLGELPVVGTYIFNKKKATEDEKELLIIVTPEIVRPMDAEEVPPMPGWYVTHPDDFDLFKFNRTEGNPDLGHYQLLPYGNGQGYAQDMGYNFYNPPPADQQIFPAASGVYGAPGSYPAGSSQMLPAAPNYSTPTQNGYGAPVQNDSSPYAPMPQNGAAPYAPPAAEDTTVEPRATPTPQLAPSPIGPTSSRLSQPSRSIQQASGVKPAASSPQRQSVIDRFRRR